MPNGLNTSYWEQINGFWHERNSELLHHFKITEKSQIGK